MKKLVSSGSEFEKKWGYSRAVVDGDDVFVSGTTGFDYLSMTISPDPVAQASQALLNIRNVLEGVGASLEDVLRARYYVTSADHWPAIAEVIGGSFGDSRPAATAVVAGLVDPRMLVEIEVTARIGAGKKLKKTAKKHEKKKKAKE